MVLTEDELTKLESFSSLKLKWDQVKIILRRKLTKSEWKTITPKDYCKIFTPIAKQAANTANVKGYLKPNYAKIFRDVADQQIKREYGDRPSSTQQSSSHFKQIFSNIAKQAAKVAKRKQVKVSEEKADKLHFIKLLYKDSEEKYQINNISKYYSTKYKTDITTWKISGSVNFFNINKVMKQLIQRMTERLHTKY